MFSKFFSVLLLISFAASNAHAYIDPGSGSAILSAIIGAIVAGAMAIKTFWYKITGFFRRDNDSDRTSDR